MEGNNVPPQESDKETSVQPYQAMRDVLREITRRQEGRPETSGEDTQRLLREARAGAMYDYAPSD